MNIDLILAGQSYSLNDGTLCAWIGDDNVGALPIERLESRGPMQSGVSDEGYRIDPRYMRLYLEINATTLEQLYEQRERLLGLFAPHKRLALRYTIGERVRQIDCFFSGDMALPTSDRNGFNQLVVIGLKAADPTFYDPTAVSISFEMGGGSGGYAIPLAVPTEVGSSVINQTLAIEYAGSVDAAPHLVRLTGPITSPVITNSATGEKLDFAGFTIAADDFYEINLSSGRVQVLDASGSDHSAELTADSDATNWHIAAAEDGSLSRSNSITVSGSAASTASRVDILFYTRYSGI